MSSDIGAGLEVLAVQLVPQLVFHEIGSTLQEATNSAIGQAA
jgi:hypothetical protein